jgi:hypothetical protein
MGNTGKLPDATNEAWEVVLASLCRLQSVPPDAVLVGGTASALYAAHRFSFDHVLPNLRDRFDSVLEELEAVAGWETARVRRPVLILGSLDGVETSVRQLRRTQPLETTVIRVGEYAGTLPTLPEVLRIKAFCAWNGMLPAIISIWPPWPRIWGSRPPGRVVAHG